MSGNPLLCTRYDVSPPTARPAVGYFFESGRTVAWIESHQTLERHAKTIHLQRILNSSRVTGRDANVTGRDANVTGRDANVTGRDGHKVSRNEVIGLLHRFWWWALDTSPDGDVTDFCVPGFMEETFDIPENPEKSLAEALIESKWLDREDEKIVIHNHEKYRGKISEAREASRIRSEKYREKRRASRVTERDENVTERDANVTERDANVTVTKNHDTGQYNTVQNKTDKDLSVSREEVFSETLCNLAREIIGLTPEGIISGWMTVQKWPEDWITEALQLSAEGGKRGNGAAQYAAGIMRGWTRDGKTERNADVGRNNFKRNGKSRGKPMSEYDAQYEGLDDWKNAPVENGC